MYITASLRVVICNWKVYSLYNTPDKIITFLGVLLRNNYTNMNKGLSSVASSHFDNDAFYVLIINSIFNWNCNGQNKSSLQKELSISLLFYMSFSSIYTDQAKIFNPCSLFFLLPSQKVMFPLQFPVDRHCLIFDPRRLKPSSHINSTFCGYVVILPNKDPFVGALSIPQFLAVDVE